MKSSQRPRPKRQTEGRSPEVAGRGALAAMLILTALIAALVLAADFLGTTGRSIVLIGWMMVMLAVLRRTQ
ncbi:MAG: hypothetical protein Kow00106_24280 [Anaerolineae bacterium]